MKNQPMNISNSSGLFRLAILPVLILLLLILLLASSGNDSITLINTNIAPTITEENKLRVALQDGSEVELKIREAARVESTQTECDTSVYEEIGSLTFVEKTMATEIFSSSAEENARKAELRIHIINKRNELEAAFLDKFGSGEFSDIESKWIKCNLVLQSDDLIYMRLRFEGPLSSK